MPRQPSAKNSYDLTHGKGFNSTGIAPASISMCYIHTYMHTYMHICTQTLDRFTSVCRKKNC